MLNAQGRSVGVLDMTTVTPLDVGRPFLRVARQSRAILTVEEHNIIGGLGGAVCEVIAEAGIGTAHPPSWHL